VPFDKGAHESQNTLFDVGRSMFISFFFDLTGRYGQIIMVVPALFLAGNFTDADAQTGPDVRLVLQITIDGLRADLINRYENGFGKGGFRYLKQQGVVYTNAHYQHANTETIVGHSAQNGSSPCSSRGCRSDDCRASGNDSAWFSPGIAAWRSVSISPIIC
jgi:hypothetical protein